MDWHIGDSKIHGKGVIADRIFQQGELIEEAICYDSNKVTYVTPYFGSYVNHSWTPNGQLEYVTRDNTHDNTRCGSWYIRSLQIIYPGEEITANYKSTPDFIYKPDLKWK